MPEPLSAGLVTTIACASDVDVGVEAGEDVTDDVCAGVGFGEPAGCAQLLISVTARTKVITVVNNFDFCPTACLPGWLR